MCIEEGVDMNEKKLFGIWTVVFMIQVTKVLAINRMKFCIGNLVYKRYKA